MASMTVQLDLNGREQAERVCACGCGRSLADMRRGAKWASRACAERWRRENPGRPLSDAYNHHKTHTRRRSGPSGVSYAARAADECLARWLALTRHLDIDDAREEAKRILFPALSARRQRERLQREAT